MLSDHISEGSMLTPRPIWMEDIVMGTLFSRRAGGLSSITASAFILLYQFAQIISC